MSHHTTAKPVTLKEVARQAGLSYQTVSRAINGLAEINAQTREHVLRVAKQLGYRPNRLAASLRTQQSRVIGLIMSNVANLFFAEIVEAVQVEASANGYSVILANSGEDIDRERDAVVTLMERRVDGLIMAPAAGDHRYLMRELPWAFPVVAINRMIENFFSGAVLVENEGGAKEATTHLIKQGHSRIGALTGNPGLMTAQERLAGVQVALREHGLTFRPEWTGGGVGSAAGRRATLEIFKQAETPTALFVSNYELAEGAVEALKELGLRAGRDVGMIIFDYVPWARLLDPPLPVVAQPTQEIGRQSVKLLLEMMGGTVREPRIVRLPTRLLRDGVREAMSANLNPDGEERRP